MTYTADFFIVRELGEMFQSVNGDVWIVEKIIGMRKGLQRATVKRIWRYV